MKGETLSSLLADTRAPVSTKLKLKEISDVVRVRL